VSRVLKRVARVVQVGFPALEFWHSPALDLTIVERG
jgi:hypothetical protein